MRQPATPQPLRQQVPSGWLVPQWPAAANVRALFTARGGGVSAGPWGGAGGGMNLGAATGDRPEAVKSNRAILQAFLPSAPRWLALEHGARVVDAAEMASGEGGQAPLADAAVTERPGVVCCVTVADCLPVFLAERQGRAVAVAHAGWRGLAAGVLQATVRAMRARAGLAGATIDAFLGPCIGPEAFEVGADVLAAMAGSLPDAERAFRPIGGGKFLADLPALARQALAQEAIPEAGGGQWCTFSDPDRFYSFRRDRVTGRHAALIWLQEPV